MQKPRWVKNQEARQNKRTRMLDAISNCREGDYGARPGFVTVKLFVEQYSLRTLWDNFRVSAEEYSRWLKESQRPQAINVGEDELRDIGADLSFGGMQPEEGFSSDAEILDIRDRLTGQE